MNMIKRMQNILTMDPQPDIVQLLTWVSSERELHPTHYTQANGL